MAAPTLVVTFDFSSGATFGYPFIIGEGVLGLNTLANAAADIIDISDQVARVQINRGYNLLQEDFQAGLAAVRVIDPTGAWNPTNPASPYYGKLVPLRKVRISANDAFLYSGYTTAYNYTFDQEQNIGYVDIQLSDAFRLLNMSNLTGLTGSSAGQTTGERVTAILNTIGFPNSMRDIDTGSTTVATDPGTPRTALQAVKNIEFCEQGGFYIAPSGNAEFKSRQYIQEKSGETPIYFSNAGDGINYKNIVTALDDKLIVNESSITRAGGTAQTAFNEPSAIKYFPHSFTATDLLLETDAQALDVARVYVSTRAETTLRIDALTLDLNSPDYAAGITAALNIDFFDSVKIKNVGQDGSTIEKTLQCMGVKHDITPASWLTTFTTSEPIVDAFIISSSLFGIIGTSVMTY